MTESEKKQQTVKPKELLKSLIEKALEKYKPKTSREVEIIVRSILEHLENK